MAEYVCRKRAARFRFQRVLPIFHRTERPVEQINAQTEDMNKYSRGTTQIEYWSIGVSELKDSANLVLDSRWVCRLEKTYTTYRNCGKQLEFHDTQKAETNRLHFSSSPDGMFARYISSFEVHTNPKHAKH